MSDKVLAVILVVFLLGMAATMIFGPDTDTQRQQLRACEHIQNEALCVECIIGVKR